MNTIIERHSGVYAASIAADNNTVTVTVERLNSVYIASAVSSAERFRACGDPYRLFRETAEVLIRAIEEVIGYGQKRV